MRSPARLLARLRHFWLDVRHRDHVEHALDAELASYVELLADEKRRAGLSAHDALRAARAEAGDVERVKEHVRAARVDRWLYTALPDLRHAGRTLRRAPGFALIAVATLALGVGGTAGIFAVADAALLRPPAGVREPDRLISLLRDERGDTYRNFSHPDFVDLRDAARALEGLTAYRMAMLSVGGERDGGERDGAAERVRGAVVSGSYFGVLGARLALGRPLGAGDDRPDAPPAVVLSDAFWRRAFGADPAVLGATLTLNGQTFAVVGVTEPGFVGVAGGEPAHVWVPLSQFRLTMPYLGDAVLADRSAGWLALVGRLRDGASAASAAAELRNAARRLADAYPVTNAGRTVQVLEGAGLYPDDRAEVGDVLGILGGAVALLLAVTCVNVAGLLLVRSAARTREIAARLALGATRTRLARLVLAEGLVIGALAVVPAVVIAWGVARVATALQPASSLLASLQVAPDARVLGAALLLAIATGALVALVPAVRVSRVDPATVLAATSARAGGSQSRAQRTLVALQVALSAVLIVAAGLTVDALRRAFGADPGYEASRVGLASVDLGLRRYDAARGTAFYGALLERLRATPGIESATLAKTMPPRDWSSRVSIFTPGEEPPLADLRAREYDYGVQVRLNHVAPDFFATLGIPLLRGRDFTTRDDARAGAAGGVAIVSARLARQLWGNADPVGRRISWPTVYGPDSTSARPPLTVVGVAADMRYLSLTDEPPLLLYVPVLHEYDARATIAVRVACSRAEPCDPAQGAAAIARAVRAIDPTLPVSDVQTMRRHMENSLWRQRTASAWMLAFGALAVALTSLGAYGVAAQSVAARARELSVRLALGADPSTVARSVVREALTLAAAGLAIGVPAALAATRLVRATIDGATGSSVPHVALAVGAVVVATLAACVAPARRAARANPAAALRSE